MLDFLSGRRIWTPHRYQFQTTECGVGVLAIVLAHFGRDVPLEEIRRITGVSRDCLNAADIVKGARTFGLHAKPRRCEPDTLARDGFPVVVHLNFIHFVVVEGMTPTHVLLNDPHAGRLDLSRASFDDSFTGIAITFAKAEGFVADSGQGVHDPAVPTLLRPHLAGLASAVCAQIVAALALIWLALGIFTGPQALAAVALFVAGLMARNLLLAHIRNHQAAALSEALLRHILRLTAEALSYRMPARLAEVLAAPDRIARALFGVIAIRWLDLLCVPVLLVGLSFVAPGLALILAGLAGLIGACYALALPWQNGRMMPLNANGVDPAEGLAETIAQPRRWTFAGADSSFVTSAMGGLAGMHLARLNRHPSDTANAVISGLTLPALLGGAILWSLFQPNIGQTLPILILTLAIAIPFGRLPDLRGQWRIANRLLADVRDVLAAPLRAADPGRPAAAHWAGPVLTAQDVTHGFSNRKPARLHGISLNLGDAEQLGITGPSGGGKSTVGRVLAGLIAPWSGEVRFLGIPVSHGHRPVWIDKQTVFFQASLRDNLTLWDDTIPESEIWTALEAACIDTVVRRRPEGLDTVIDPKRPGFSGGQLQRLEISRALLRKPKAIILDEALDALNPALETRLRDSVRQKGIALVVISHRRSTLDACDRVLTVRGGRLVDGLTDDAPVSRSRLPIDLNLPPVAGPLPGLQEAFNTVTKEMGLGRKAQGTTLTALACSADVLCRAQRFNPEHWRFQRAPTVLLDDAAGATALGAAKSWRPSETRKGILIYDAEVEAELPLLHLLGAALWRARVDLARMAALTVGLAAVLSAWPLALIWTPNSGVTAGIAFVLALAGLGLLLIARQSAAMRASQVVERHLLLHLLLRCRVTSIGVLERMLFHRLLNAVGAVADLASAVRTDGPRCVHALALTLFGLACAWLTNGGAAPIALGLVCGACVIAPAVAALQLREMASRHHDNNTDLGRLSSHMLAGLPRLQALGADARVAKWWLRRHAMRTATALALWRRVGLVRVLPWGIALIGLALIGLPPQPGAALAALLALVGAATLGQSAIGLIVARPALDDLDHLLLASHNPRPDRHPGPKSKGIEIVRVAHVIGGQSVLKDVSACLVPGSITVLAGASGSGKSTLLDLMLGVMPPTAGEIRLDGPPLSAGNARKQNRRIGAVFQNDYLETASTLRYQLSVSEIVDVARAWHLLEQVALAEDVAAMPMGLQTIVDSNTLSTGQVQRLLIARQLAADPALLVLDEAMNAIPDDIEARLIANFRKMGLTCLIVTHRESTIRLADNVIVLENGQVVHDGDPAPVLARPEFQQALRAERAVFIS